MLNRQYIEAIRHRDPVLFRSLDDIANSIEQLGAASGIATRFGAQTARQSALSVPALAGFVVTAADGHYLVAIASNPSNPAGVPVLHEIASATTLNFDAAAGVTVYGPDPRTSWDITDPAATKYWRLRSRFANSGFGPAQFYMNPATCGPQAIYSGLLRTHSTAFAESAYTPAGGNPLTQSGTTTAINVASTNVTTPGPKGTQIAISYNSGSVDPGAYGTFFVYALDPKKTGGVVTYIGTTNNADVTGNDAAVYFGKITTTAAGGGTGTGGGGGACVSGDSALALHGGGSIRADQVRQGTVLAGFDGGPEVVQRVYMTPSQPTFSLGWADGTQTQGGMAATHLLMVDGGVATRVADLLAGCRTWTAKGVATINSRAFRAMETVYGVVLDRTRTYSVDGAWSHNALKA